MPPCCRRSSGDLIDVLAAGPLDLVEHGGNGLNR
jgi:hypothetical protein